MQRMAKLDKLQRQFIQNASHELRTPLTIAMGYAEMLRKGQIEDGGKRGGTLDVVCQNLVKLKIIVENMSTFLDVEAGQADREVVDLSQLLQHATSYFEAKARAAEVEWKAEIAASPMRVLGSPQQISVAVDNLVDNAIKFTPAGGRVVLSADRRNGSVILKVKDTGVGIPQDQLAHIFERFYQVDGSMTRRFGGAGLGLALVKEITKAHGGSVGVRSDPGQGSIFEVTLPCL